MFGFAPGCLGLTVHANADTLAPKPKTLTFEAAATAPTVYLTVLAAFNHGKGLGPQTRVLVHAGTGGVGLAAVSIGSALGCQVLATAGSATKRGHLRRQGLKQALDSRSASFTDPLLSCMGPADLVLNSLTSAGRFSYFFAQENTLSLSSPKKFLAF